jgi:hypothetical protein
VHYYAGAKPDAQPADGEEAIFEGINWEPFTSHIRHYLPEVEISVPEGGWYAEEQREGKSESDLNKMIEFIETMKVALGDNDLPGLHVLYQKHVTFHNWLYQGGVTEVGAKHDSYFKEINEPTPPPVEPEEPDNNLPDKDAKLVSYRIHNIFSRTKKVQKLVFDDGGVIEYRKKGWWDFCWKPFNWRDSGRTAEEIWNDIKDRKDC